MAEELGFSAPEKRKSQHVAVTHKVTGETVFYPATPSDHRDLNNVITKLERVAGRKRRRDRGYSGGSAKMRSRLAQKTREGSFAQFVGPSLAGQAATTAMNRLRDRLAATDEELADAVAAGRVDQVRNLMSQRGPVVEELTQRYHQPVDPMPDVEGIEAVLANPASTASVDDLKNRFNR